MVRRAGWISSTGRWRLSVKALESAHAAITSPITRSAVSWVCRLSMTLHSSLLTYPRSGAHQGGGDAGDVEGPNAKALELVPVLKISSGTAPYRKSQISKSQWWDTERELPRSMS